MSELPVTRAVSTVVIDLDAMDRNLEQMKRKARTNQVLAVVKANAYGHGAIEVARWLEGKVAGFAVATVDEGVQLRNGGVQSPILVFGPPCRSNRGAYTEYRLMATVSHLDHFEQLPAGTSYHINLDTGMRRLGICPEELATLKEQIARFSELQCAGIYSHYATADEPESVRVFEQYEQFKSVRSKLALKVPFHMSNTAAVMHYDSIDHFDMIRVGIGLAGFTPGRTQHEALEPVMCWKTTVAQVRPVQKREPVSYGGTWKAPQDGYLLTLPVGYADGLPRSLSNKLRVTVNGVSFPSVGNITMDYTMLYSESEGVQAGDEVHLMGGTGWRANRIAEQSGSITHEILCRLGSRIQRKYRAEGRQKNES
ncbi:MAG: alanine racemase [Balneolaceae bacterium]